MLRTLVIGCIAITLMILVFLGVQVLRFSEFAYAPKGPLDPNTVQGTAQIINGREYTLNLEQQLKLLRLLGEHTESDFDQAVALEESDEDRSLLLYRYTGEKLQCIPVGRSDGRSVWSVIGDEQVIYVVDGKDHAVENFLYGSILVR